MTDVPLFTHTHCMDSGCIGGDYIISQNTTITPPQLITASYFLPSPSSPPANVLNFGYNGNDFRSWCTDTNDPNPNIVIHFSIPVVITSFISSGSTDFSFSVFDTFHVTNFTLEFAYNSSDEFRYYKTDENADRKVGIIRNKLASCGKQHKIKLDILSVQLN